MPSGTKYNAVGAVCSIPGREYGLTEIVRCWEAQTLRIPLFVFVPKELKRTGERPNKKLIDKACKGKTELIYYDNDHGSIDKIYMPLQTVSSDILITIDDDVFYPPKFVSQFMKFHALYPGAALCYRGKNLVKNNYNKSPRIEGGNYEVDLLTGTWGALYRQHWFTEAGPLLLKWSERFPTVDDIVINSFLKHKKIPRRIIPLPGHFKILPQHKENELYRINHRGPANNEALRLLYYAKLSQ